MRKLPLKWIIVVVLVLQLVNASAIVFTNDTVISPNNTNYDGQSIILSNCTVTVDGAHTFVGVRVTAGSVLTHSSSPNGNITVFASVSDEPHLLVGTNPVSLISTNIVISSIAVRDTNGTVTYSNTADYLVGISNSLTTIQRTETSAIPDEADVLVSYEYSTETIDAGLKLTVSGDFEVDAGAMVFADGFGFGGNIGNGNGLETGSPLTGGGGSYGGFGGMSSSNAAGGPVYGSLYAPNNLGSGGGSGAGGVGGAGGGLIQLTIGGNFIVNGTVTAGGLNATNNRSGGGSGGSIWVVAQDFIGAGTIRANGGAGEPIHGGGGGGGRISIEFQTNLFAGTIISVGGAGAQRGGAGTIFTRKIGTLGQVRFSNGGSVGAATSLQFSSPSDLTVEGGAIAAAASSQIIANLLVRSNSSMTTTTTNNATLTLTVQSNLTVESTGKIDLDGRGFMQNQGSGVGAVGFGNVGGGGGHGGYGGNGQSPNGFAAGGVFYGSLTAPQTLGSGGRSITGTAGGAGGGAVRLSVTGRLQLDGKISVDGAGVLASGAGCGAGGSIWLTSGEFSGSGIVSANGGSGGLPYGGGGAGGRIAITYASNSFSGTITAYGGQGAVAGAAGTIYLKRNADSYAMLQIANGGVAGTNTVLDSGNSYHVSVTGGANLRVNLSSVTFGTLSLSSNASLILPNTLLTVTGNVAVASGGRISCDGLGFVGTGPGLGQTSTTGSGGGGHGGSGGNGSSSSSHLGGTSSGSVSNPTQFGGGGGGVSSSGGAGGGSMRMNVSGLLDLEGDISANGMSAITNNAGGGAGGSIWLTVGRISGNGIITADGGAGLPTAGGGGGGRIALYYSSNFFTGRISAKGGNGFNRGGAGTVYYKAAANSVASILVDNGTFRGTNTLISSLGTQFDVTVQNGGILTLLNSPRDIIIRSNAWLVPSGSLSVTRNATVELGGTISLDGIINFGSGNGSSSTQNPRGGGGHGGYGALNPPNFGNAYGFAVSPTTLGSPGGHGSGTSGASPFGGNGGGAVRLIVSNTLTNSGKISADGLHGDSNSGGGSGGSVWLSVGTLTGNGLISAIGGNGNGSAGGGGGGRISIDYVNNSFTGTISACGGTGAEVGGAGTIYLRSNNQSSGTLLVNNCGRFGTNTPLSQSIGMGTNIVVAGGAVTEMQGTIPAISNLFISNGGTVTGRSADTQLNLVVGGDVLIDSSSALAVDGKGYARASGPGAGATLSSKGSGGGYGGLGGGSASGANGGSTYGSMWQPLDRGSGGGSGVASSATGSAGGGALRLSVGGSLVIDGLLAANGGQGLQDDSGGGAGGSIWVTASQITGGGAITADGGDGELFGGGGGGGGRIALYSSMNTFTGMVSAAGGIGSTSGNFGTIYNSSEPFGAISHSPVGTISNTPSQIMLEFNAPINSGTLSVSDVSILTPGAILPMTNFSISVVALSSLRITFPPQNTVGEYRFEIGPDIQNTVGQTMSQIYTGFFTVELPTIFGMITDTNGQPVSGVLLQPSDGLLPTTTDTNGMYSLGVPPGWNGTVTPSLSPLVFIPAARSYSNVLASILNQNYLTVSSITPQFQMANNGTNLFLNWNGFSEVIYQAYYSTNLINWFPFDSPMAGSNGPMQLIISIENDSHRFFRLGRQN